MQGLPAPTGVPSLDILAADPFAWLEACERGTEQPGSGDQNSSGGEQSNENLGDTELVGNPFFTKKDFAPLLETIDAKRKEGLEDLVAEVAKKDLKAKVGAGRTFGSDKQQLLAKGATLLREVRFITH